MENQADQESPRRGVEETPSPKETPDATSSRLIEWEWDDE